MKQEGSRIDRITLADVAACCGFHRSTVGLALRSHPSIPKSTRDCIVAVAKKMGYRPDPTLLSLVAYRHQKSNRIKRSAIAIISDADNGVKYWRADENRFGVGLYHGFTEQADALGYSVEEYSVGIDRNHTKRVNSILRARGITAVAITGLVNLEDPIDLDWDNISAVSMSYSLSSPNLPRIITQHRSNAFLGVSKLLEYNYRRIGMVISYEHDARVDHGWQAGFLSACYMNRHRLDHHSLRVAEAGSEHENLANQSTLQWVRENNLDAVLTSQQHLAVYLRENGIAIPEQLGFVALDLTSDESVVSGIDQNDREIGRLAVNILAGLQRNNIRGIPKSEQIHLVRGLWKEGTTLQEQPPSPDATGDRSR